PTGGHVTEWIIRRWARHGHDRLYAATPGGTDLGYLDVATGRYHSDDLSNLPLLRAAVAEHLEAQRQGQPEPTPAAAAAWATERASAPATLPDTATAGVPPTSSATSPTTTPPPAPSPASSPALTPG